MPCIHVVLRSFTSLDTEAVAAIAKGGPQPLSSFQDAHHRQRLAAAFRREVLARATARPEDALTFTTTETGKPCLAGNALSFNVSHTRTACVVAWCHAGIELGVDIEDRSRRPHMAEIAASSFSEEERAHWSDSCHSPETWLSIWTRKEALLKCSGEGLGAGLATTDTGDTDRRHVALHGKSGAVTLQTWILAQQILSLAWRSQHPEPDILLDASSQ